MDETSEDERRSHKKRNSCSSWFGHFVFSCCCAGFLNPNGEGSKEYYETLGISRHAKLSEIKKAYKKLSLSFHPDKLRQRGETLTEEMQEKFRKIKQAYEVLSDPERRKIYDSLGINGINLREDPGSFMQNPAKLQELVNKADKRAWCVVLSITTTILGFLFICPILFALQVDGDIDISFVGIFTPLWIVYLLVFFGMFMDVLRGKNEKPEDLEEGEEWFDDHPLFERVVGLFTFLLFVLFQVMLLSKLDGGFDSDHSWVMVMIPYYLFEIFEIFSRWLSMRNALAHAAHHENEADKKELKENEDEMLEMEGLTLRMAAEENRVEARIQVSAMIYHWYRLVQVFIIVLRVNGSFGNASWWLVLIPSMMYAVLSCGEFGRNRYKAGIKSKELDEMMEAPLPESAKEHRDHELKKAQASSKKEFLLSFGMSQCCSGCCLTLYLLILGFYLTQDDDDRFSFFWFYFPFACLFAIPLCCLCCLSVCGFGEEEEEEDEVEEVDINDMDEKDIKDLENALKESLGGEDVDPLMVNELLNAMQQVEGQSQSDQGQSDGSSSSSLLNNDQDEKYNENKVNLIDNQYPESISSNDIETVLLNPEEEENIDDID